MNKYITWDQFLEIFNDENYVITYEKITVHGENFDDQILINWEENDLLFEYQFKKSDNEEISVVGNQIILLGDGETSDLDKFVFEVFELKPAEL